MNGKIRLSCAIVLLAVVGCHDAQPPKQAQATTTQPSYDTLADIPDLVDDPSRAELTEMEAEPAERQRPITTFNLNLTLVPNPFTFPEDTKTDDSTHKPRTDSTFGIDISRYQSVSIPLEHLQEMNVAYVYIKAGQGLGKDPKFTGFWGRMEKLQGTARVAHGAYFFLAATQDPAAQAQIFHRILAANGGLQSTDMPPAMDLEADFPTDPKTKKINGPDRWIGQSPKQIVDKVLTFLQAVQANTGRRPMIYTNKAWWASVKGTPIEFARLSPYLIWVSGYPASNRPNVSPVAPLPSKWSLWQFTSTAKLGTQFSDGVDASIFRGTAQQFTNTFGLAPFK